MNPFQRITLCAAAIALVSLAGCVAADVDRDNQDRAMRNSGHGYGYDRDRRDDRREEQREERRDYRGYWNEREQRWER